jgi:calcineurin-like phosphoesterase family protein
MWWYTGDQHFNHAKIIQYCSRPFVDVQEMNEAIVRNHNLLVKENDMVVHVGDFMFTGPGGARAAVEQVNAMLDRLNGNHILLLGNHDRKNVMRRANWQDVQSEMYITLSDSTHVVRVSHLLPPKPEWSAHACTSPILIHGHQHEKGLQAEILMPRLVRVNVGVDQWEFRPVAESTIQFLYERAIGLV